MTNQQLDYHPLLGKGNLENYYFPIDQKLFDSQLDDSKKKNDSNESGSTPASNQGGMKFTILTVKFSFNPLEQKR